MYDSLNSVYPIVSISILSSGREKTIKKCLESITEFRKKVPSELIVVDTTGTGKLDNIILQYTNIIYKFIWDNDFSKARNIGLEHAKGEWFFYIDDDEWFEDTNDLEYFFTSGTYKNYGEAHHRVRNYIDIEGRIYSDIWVNRLFKLCSETRFIGKIHEYPTHVAGDSRLINSFSHHFGYAYKDEDERKKHQRRNLPLMEEMVRDYPEDVRFRTHYVNELRGLRDFNKLKLACEEAIIHITNNLSKETEKDIGTFYSGILQCYAVNHDYKNGIERFNNMINDKRLTDMGRARIYAIASLFYYSQNDYNNCLMCCTEYKKVYDFLKSNDIEQFLQGGIFISEVFDRSISCGVWCFKCLCHINNNDSLNALSAFNDIDIFSDELYLPSGYIEDLIDSLNEALYSSKYLMILRDLFERDYVNEMTVKAIQHIVSENRVTGIKRLLEEIFPKEIVKGVFGIN